VPPPGPPSQDDLTPRAPRQHRPADSPEVDSRELGATCSYGQDTGIWTEVLPREEEAIIVAARSAPTAAEPPRLVIIPGPTAVPAPETAAQHYRDKVINPGALPVEGAREELAATNLRTFVDAVRERALLERDVPGSGGEVGEPVRDLELDRDGRFGWKLPVNGAEVSILMPGANLGQVRELGAAAPCLQINGNWAWWNDAVSAAVPLPSR